MNKNTQLHPIKSVAKQELRPPIIALEVVLPGIVEPSGLQFRQRNLNEPKAGQVLVQVEATGVSFAEQQMRRGRYPGQPKFPFVPGYDLVGNVLAVGEGVPPALVGKRVAALTKTGGWASHVLLSAQELMFAPENLDPAEIEALIVNGVTAWQMLHRVARVRRGQTILVHGANGGVGSVLVQLAQRAGVRVIGTASPRHHDALGAIGVEPLDYNDKDLEGRLRKIAPQGVNAVFDHVGGDSLVTSFKMLARKGTLVAYGTASKRDDSESVLRVFATMMGRIVWWNLLPNGHKVTFYNV